MKFIKRIRVHLSHTKKVIDIDLNGRNLIITGGNGCGKTRLVEQIKDGLERIALLNNKETADLIRNNITHYKRQINSYPPTQQVHHAYINDLKKAEKELEIAEQQEIELFNDTDFVSGFKSQQIVLKAFEATRQSDIKIDNTSTSLKGLVAEDQGKTLDKDFGYQFDKYLVAMRQMSNEILAREQDKSEAKIIEDWFQKLTFDLQELFEDSELQLVYNRDEQLFNIVQPNKSPFRFDQLSSGYSAIMSIYSDLLMKVKLKDINPNELSGIVIIDEVCAHLHVSIQRKILAFLSKSFPSIQFIVTTHSPFVVQSVKDAVIYDLSRCEALEDLSMYSYESIIKGLLQTDNTSSELQQLVNNMADELDASNTDWEIISDGLNRLKSNFDKLDVESRVFYRSTELALENHSRKMLSFSNDSEHEEIFTSLDSLSALNINVDRQKYIEELRSTLGKRPGFKSHKFISLKPNTDDDSNINTGTSTKALTSKSSK